MKDEHITLGKQCSCGADTYRRCNDDGSECFGLEVKRYYPDGTMHYFHCTACPNAYSVLVPEGVDDFRQGRWTLIDPPSYRCWECGQATKYLEESLLCVICDNWHRLMVVADHEAERGIKVAKINGHHYVIEPEDDQWPSRGFGGQEFTIRFFDGRSVTTTNLWYQGEIPERFRARMPDNAAFVGPAPRVYRDQGTE